ncbi:uncharacterized protein LOC135386913 [Ornithodoros turicata]|uniref:uncharacterized protein LOC135386913 n=1 Tax=Ornithodoros turicata TaxID=34597 RepID=UPI003139A903
MRKKLDDNPAELAMRDKHGKKRVKPPEEACPNATKRISRLHGHEHLVVLGETEQSLENHRQWLICHSEEEESQVTKERFLLTAKERHEKIMTVTLAAALSEFPFLATESALLLEFSLPWNLATVFENGFLSLTNNLAAW